jgi:glycosyltransferase involved in cell wall biosynthesis
LTTVHLLGGQLGDPGGVADYTSVLAGALSTRGVTVCIWEATTPGFRTSLEQALAACPGPLIVQYVPNAFGWRGANVPFCRWLLRLRHRGHDVRVMFHEPYFYFGAHPLRNGLAIVQRVMASMLLGASTVTYLSTDTWRRYLTPYAPAGAMFVTLPIPATVGQHRDAARESGWRSRLAGSDSVRLVGHFGTYGGHVTAILSPVLEQLLTTRANVRVVCVGQGSESYARRYTIAHPSMAGRVTATGPLRTEDVAAVLRACDVAVQPYPDGVTTRRTSVMAALANGVATVTSSGALTERVWRESGAVALADAGDARAHVEQIGSLLDDERRRVALAARGAEIYDSQFSIERTLDQLTGAGLAATA